MAIDAIRVCKVARDNRLAGPLPAISAFTMKHPPLQLSDEMAYRQVQDFIAKFTIH